MSAVDQALIKIAEWLRGAYLVRDDESDPNKNNYKPYKIEDVAAWNSDDKYDSTRIFVLLAGERSKKLLSLGSIVNEDIFSTEAAALEEAARQQKEEDEADSDEG